MDADAARLAISVDGQELLASLPPYREAEAVALTTRLRKAGHSPELVAGILTQARLRAKAVEKFGERAQSMAFTPDALEQATRDAVAVRHAQRFVDAGVTSVADGGCGIGSDALRFAAAGLQVLAIEADEATSELARFNLRAHPNATVRTLMLQDQAPGEFDAMPGPRAWWFDPARRVSGLADIRGRTKRTFSLEALSPSWELVQALASSADAAGAKLSPSFAHADIPAACEAEFVSFGGDVVECTLWWGRAVQHVGRTASVIRQVGGETSVRHVTEADAVGAPVELASKDTLGDFFYEADKALTRSGLVGALLNTVEGEEFSPGFGYVSSDQFVDVSGLGRAYRVLDVVPLNVKTLRTYLRERKVGRLTIKKRDVDLDADALRRDLKLKGSADLTIVLAHLDGERVALVVEPATPA